MRRVGLLTSADMPRLHEDEAPFVEALARVGVVGQPLVWGPAALCAEVEGFVVRTPWDWCSHVDAFKAFLAQLPEARTFNAPSMMRRYLDKAYLFELRDAGNAIPPTVLVDGASLEVEAAIAERGWSRAVVKPLCSAGARQTYLVDEGAVPTLTEDRWLVQRFLPEVEEGELSLVFFDGEFSHAARKRPRRGDFRVQAEHGGSVEAATPSASLIAQAARALTILPTVPLYARVDGVVVNDRLLVMELELVEPQLFFSQHPEAGDRLARALLRRLDRMG